MRWGSDFRDGLFGSGLVVALTLAFGVASVLATVGLFLELAGTRTVVTQRQTPLPPNPDVYRRDLTLSPDLFVRTLVRLAEQGVETVTMADLYEHFAGGPRCRRRRSC